MRLTQLLRTVLIRPTLPTLQSRSFQHDFVPKPLPHKPKKYKYPDFYDPYGPRPPPSDKIIKLADRITGLSEEERGQLRTSFRYCLELPETVIFKGGGGIKSEEGSGEEKGEEKKVDKSVFDVKLEKFEAATKLKVVKEVRDLTKLGLKESKELVEKVPCVVKSGVTKEEGESIIKKIKAAGGVAVME